MKEKMTDKEMLDHFGKLYSELKTERSNYDRVWRDIADNLAPTRTRFLTSDRNQNRQTFKKLLNNTPLRSQNILRSGMHSGITSPARPWFRLTTPDPSMAEFGPVRQWLHQVSQRMQTVYSRSNIYSALPIIYSDVSVFGSAAAMLFEDEKDVIRAYNYPIGSYVFGTDNRGVVNTFITERKMTVGQILAEFGDKNLSATLKALVTAKNYNAAVDVTHVIAPNREYDGRKPHMGSNKPFVSCHFESGCTEGKLLHKSGFEEWLGLTPRWDLTGNDSYGIGLGQMVLGDAQMLQKLEAKELKAVDKMIDPPMVADASLKNQPLSLLPGDVTYQSVNQGGDMFKPAHQVNFNLAASQLKVKEAEKRIYEGFYADLFLMLALSDRRQMTATEVAERHEEKLLMLGPVLERLNDELLDPLIDRTFSIMARKGLLPPAPPELEGVDLKVEHVSIMAQAQKSVSLQSVDRLTGFVGNLAQFDPSVLDKYNFDQAVDDYADMLGTSPALVRSDEQVAAIRQQRQQAQQAQQMAQQVQAEADVAAKLGNASTEAGTVLGDLTSAMKQEVQGG